MRTKKTKLLYCIRHGTGEKDLTLLHDFHRPLSQSGILKTAFLVKQLENFKKWPIPDCILCSSALRAVQTYEMLSVIYPGVQVYTRDSLYLAPAARLKYVLGTIDPLYSCVMIIAHQHGLKDFIHELSPAAARQNISMETSACVALDIHETTWGKLYAGCGTLKGQIVP